MKETLKSLGYPILAARVDPLISLCRFLQNNCTEPLIEAATRVVKHVVAKGIEFFQTVITKIFTLSVQRMHKTNYWFVQVDNKSCYKRRCN